MKRMLMLVAPHYRHARSILRQYYRLRALTLWRFEYYKALNACDVAGLREVIGNVPVENKAKLDKKKKELLDLQRTPIDEKAIKTRIEGHQEQFDAAVADIPGAECDVCHTLNENSKMRILAKSDEPVRPVKARGAKRPVEARRTFKR